MSNSISDCNWLLLLIISILFSSRFICSDKIFIDILLFPPILFQLASFLESFKTNVQGISFSFEI